MAPDSRSPGHAALLRHADPVCSGHRCASKAQTPHAPVFTRRSFVAWLALAPFAWAGVAMLDRMRGRTHPAPLAIPADVPVGLSIAADVVVNRSAAGTVRAFSARCTHLGCRLERVVDGVIVCSCHGSRFHADGRVAAGPAARPLEELRVKSDSQTGGWTVDVG